MFFKSGLTINEINSEFKLSFYDNFAKNTMEYKLKMSENSCKYDQNVFKLGIFKTI